MKITGLLHAINNLFQKKKVITSARVNYYNIIIEVNRKKMSKWIVSGKLKLTVNLCKVSTDVQPPEKFPNHWNKICQEIKLNLRLI